MKGRKPKPNAQRRGGTQPAAVVPAVLAAQGETAVVLPPRAEKPAHVAGNPLQSECWDNLVGLAGGFEPCDVPLLESYCYWYSVLRQAEQNTIDSLGNVATLAYAYDADGNQVGIAGVNPDIKTAEHATNMLRHLGDVLRINPSARDRAKLMDAVTKSTQADVVRKTIDGYEAFKAAQKALNAAK